MEDIEHIDLTADEELLLAEDPDIPDHQVEDVYLFGQTWHIQHQGHFYGIAPPGHPFPDGFNGQPVEIGYPDDSPPPSPEYSDIEFEPYSQAEHDHFHQLWMSRVSHVDHQPGTNKSQPTKHFIYGMHVPLEDFAE